MLILQSHGKDKMECCPSGHHSCASVRREHTNTRHVLALSGRGGEYTQPSLRFLAEYCISSINFMGRMLNSIPEFE